MTGYRQRWRAPSTTTPVHATVEVPGSKSQTNRALILAALATPQGTSTITGALRSRDTDLMIGALRTLGVSIEGSTKQLSVGGTISPAADATIDCGLAGTVLRFVPPVAALGGQAVTFDGDEQARSRPIAPLLDALRGIGVDLEGDSLPFVVRGAGAVRRARCTSTRRRRRNSCRGCCVGDERLVHRWAGAQRLGSCHGGKCTTRAMSPAGRCRRRRTWR